jgi:glycosyltransferase involved in cell wall biosynthesis
VSRPLVSVVVVNHNYAAYAGAAIESALGQTYPNVEVIVVDDGSVDSSRDVIATFGDAVTAVLKENGGQGSAFTAGFERARGDIVQFLDADDELLPETAARVVDGFEDPGVVKVHWPLWVVDGSGRRTSGIKEPVLPEGDLRAEVERYGPMTERTLPSAPTSGNAYRRDFLELVMPVPAGYRISADAYLFGLAPAFGALKTIPVPNGKWRFHGANAYNATASFEEKLANGLRDYECQLETLLRLRPDLREVAPSWRAHAWWPRIADSIGELDGLLDEGSPFVLADGDSWGAPPVVRGRLRFPLLERDGIYWGAPSSSDEAIAEVERLRGEGAAAVAFAWPVFWWFDCYAGLEPRLRAQLPCLLENDRLLVFGLSA